MNKTTQNTLPIGYVLCSQSYNYKIEKVLGQGSFGITYLAKRELKGAFGQIDRKLNVAIKEFFMKEVNGRSEKTVTSSTSSKGGLFYEYKEKFIREAKNLTKLKHPHIVKIMDYFEANNTCYYVMEYLPGGDLDSLIEKKGHLSEVEASNYVIQIGRALQFMHDNRMLHLDMKPQNVVLDEEGNAVVIDFGLSKQYDKSGEPESSTSVGQGTPGYAPIEQANYQEGHGFPVTMDVYALGATLFKMLTGVRPPVASIILNDGFPSAQLRKNASVRLSQVVEKAMEPLKKNRYPSIDEMLNALVGQDQINSIFSTNSDEVTIVDNQTSSTSNSINSNTSGRSNFNYNRQGADSAQKNQNKKIGAQESNEDVLYRWGRELSIMFICTFIGSIWGITHNNFYLLTFSSINSLILIVPEYFDISNRFENILRKVIPILLILNCIVLGYSIYNYYSDGMDTSHKENVKRNFKFNKHGIYTIVFTVNGVSFDMCHVSGGSFQMGSDDSDAWGNEKPVFNVTLDDYYIGQCEVTQALWKAIMGSNPSVIKGDSLPVVCVSGKDCEIFINKLNSATGKRFRLPTEAEWEFAARGGNESKGNRYSGSNDIETVAWYDLNSKDKLHPIASKQSNELGLYDMSGNVWEWCFYHGTYNRNAQVNPRGPVNGSYRICRGGGYTNTACECRTSCRIELTPDYKDSDLGLRLVLTP